MDFKQEITGLIAKATGLKSEFVYEYLEIPPERNLGDFALPCFRLSKELRKAPQKIAEEIYQQFSVHMDEPAYSLVKECKVTGGYFNVFVDRKAYISAVMQEVMVKKERYGTSEEGHGKTVLVEFSSPNIAKPFHIGHLFTTALGNSLERIYRSLGYKTISVNHIGDWGTQFGKLISAYKRWGDANELKTDTIQELLRVYVKFHQEVIEHPELDDEARGYFKMLEENVPDIKALWQEFRDFSMREFDRVYQRLGIRFDSTDGESFYSDKMDEVIRMLSDKSLLTDSDNAKIVDLSDKNIPPCMILKSDGATIYATRDLAAAIYRKRIYDFYKNIYVVGLPQSLHFKQIFSVLDKMGYEWASDCVHVGFGMVRFKDRQMATREGEIIFLEDVLNESVKRAKTMMDADRNLENPEKIAEIIGIGAVIYTFLKNNRERDIIFSWEEMLDLEGESGPYVQYTHARANSVLKKAGDIPDKADYTTLEQEEEFELVDLINGFADAIKEAAYKYEPAILTRQITAIARAYNKFYHFCKILEAEPELRNARIHLCYAVKLLIGKGLELLGIVAPEQM